MSMAVSNVNALRRQRPEWGPWLAVVEEVVREAATSRWDAAVPTHREERRVMAPLLAAAPLAPEAGDVRRLLKRLVRVAASGGSAKMATLNAALGADLDVVTLFLASVYQKNDCVRQIASLTGTDPDALQAVVALLPVPFLHACNRRWAASLSGSWVEGYCPLCGSWPAFAEVRGIERRRYFRCGRCGGEWHAHALSCAYCGTSDHHELVSLVPGHGASHSTIEACTRCLGYVKTFTTLQGCAPGAVIVEDLASVDLDVAALQAGYARPQGAGYQLAPAVA